MPMPREYTPPEQKYLSDVIEQTQWFASLDERNQLKVLHALLYRHEFWRAGISGHTDFLLLAQLADLLTELEQRVTEANSQAS